MLGPSVSADRQWDRQKRTEAGGGGQSSGLRRGPAGSGDREGLQPSQPRPTWPSPARPAQPASSGAAAAELRGREAISAHRYSVPRGTALCPASVRQWVCAMSPLSGRQGAPVRSWKVADCGEPGMRCGAAGRWVERRAPGLGEAGPLRAFRSCRGCARTAPTSALSHPWSSGRWDNRVCELNADFLGVEGISREQHGPAGGRS